MWCCSYCKTLTRIPCLVDDAIALGHDDLLAQYVVFLSRKKHVAEAFFREHPGPGVRCQSRATRQAQRGILIAPPTLEEAKGEVDEEGTAVQLVEQEQAAPAQCRLGIGQGPANVFGGVQHVGGDDQVVATHLDTLRGNRLLHVEELHGKEGMRGRVFLLGVQQEGSGDVSIAILADVGLVWLELRQDHRGGAASARPDLEDAYALRRRFTSQAFADVGHDGVTEDFVKVVGHHVALIDALHQLHRAVGEHDVGGLAFPGENLGQSAEAVLDQENQRLLVGICQPRLFACVPFAPERLEIERCRIIDRDALAVTLQISRQLQESDGFRKPAFVVVEKASEPWAMGSVPPRLRSVAHGTDPAIADCPRVI